MALSMLVPAERSKENERSKRKVLVSEELGLAIAEAKVSA